MKDRNSNERFNNSSVFLNVLYKSILGRIFLKILVQPFFSQCVGVFLDSHYSKLLITPFIKKNKIDMSRYKKQEYQSFNEFFKRELRSPKIPTKLDKQSLYAPCDGLLSVYVINQEKTFSIKNSCYTLGELLNNQSLANQFEEGTMLVFRLTPKDYHHYYFIDNGSIDKSFKINGLLHTVQPIAFNHEKVFLRNSREVTLMNTLSFDKVVQIEVGALLVGKISNHSIKQFNFFQKKGEFEFGGSTIILLFKKDIVLLNKDIMDNSKDDLETKVELGTRLGIARRNLNGT